jgi:hypothetical protein
MDFEKMRIDYIEAVELKKMLLLEDDTVNHNDFFDAINILDAKVDFFLRKLEIAKFRHERKQQ